MTHCYETDRRKGKGVMSFGTQLRLARKHKGLTQKELADRVGARHNTVSNWEADRNRPDPGIVRSLCTLLEVDSNYFYETDPVDSQLSGIEFALFGEMRQLSEQDKQDVLEFIRFKKAMSQKRDEK